MGSNSTRPKRVILYIILSIIALLTVPPGLISLHKIYFPSDRTKQERSSHYIAVGDLYATLGMPPPSPNECHLPADSTFCANVWVGAGDEGIPPLGGNIGEQDLLHRLRLPNLRSALVAKELVEVIHGDLDNPEFNFYRSRYVGMIDVRGDISADNLVVLGCREIVHRVIYCDAELGPLQPLTLGKAHVTFAFDPGYLHRWHEITTLVIECFSVQCRRFKLSSVP